MSMKNRPYVGSWEMGTQSVVRYTPDAKVLINGHTELAVCATCGDSTDFNKYITTISCDVSTDPVSTASLTLAIPRHEADVFSHDGNYVLHPGLEVVILMRGYFPITGYALKGQEGASDETAETDSADDTLPVYPYYQVFRGVITEVSHEFSGGFYTASISCSSILHFWQYLYINTSGSVFGGAPEGAKEGINLSGHKFTGLSPYGIIYTLMRVGFGAAFGQNWTISQATNISAVDEASGQSLYKHAAIWWEKRWAESSMRLRMYGMDGSLYNAMSQAYLGMFDNDHTNTGDFIKTIVDGLPDDYNPTEGGEARQTAARTFGYRGTLSNTQAIDGTGAGIDAMKMQAYTLDLGRLGQVNMFDSEYMSKLEIANAVKQLCGFEFYQDVDGDIVFKPPFYNLDTSTDEVYCIRDRDLLSCSESEREPEATYVKGSGSLMQNFTGVLDGTFGTKEAKFADWRLIAQFGWRETSFESQYYSGAKQMFIGAIMRLDVANAEMRTAQITIPMRPELRAGYPVWVEHLDCFFYAKSISHSFSPGSAAQTTITGIAKRAKWLPPGLPDRSEGPGSRNLPTLDDMRLDSPGDYPPMPLYVFPEDIEGADPEASGPPRVMGLPNVVMALDPEKVNPEKMPGGVYFTNGQTYFDTALNLGALRRDPENPEQYRVAIDNEPTNDQIVTEQQVITAFDDYAAARQEAVAGGSTEPRGRAIARLESTEIGRIINAVEARMRTAVPDADQINNYMGLQRNLKNVFGAGEAVGQYRYFSSSAPRPEDQSPSSVRIDAEIGEVSKEVPGGPVDAQFSGLTQLYQKGDRIGVRAGLPTRGFRVYGFNAPPEGDDDEEVDTSIGHIDCTTRDIRFITFQKITTRIPFTTEAVGSDPRSALMLTANAYAKLFADILELSAANPAHSITTSAEDRFGGDTGQSDAGYGLIWNAIDKLCGDLNIKGGAEYADTGGPAAGSPTHGATLANFDNAFLPFSVRIQTSAGTGRTETYYVHPQWVAVPNAPVALHPRSGEEAAVKYMQGGVAYGYDDISLVERTRSLPDSPVHSRRYFPLDTSLQVGRVDRRNPGLTGQSDGKGVKAVAKQAAAALAEQLDTVGLLWLYGYGINPEGFDVPPGTEPLPAARAAWAAFMTTVTEDFGFDVSTSNGRTVLLTDEYVEGGKHTTVLPVSDNRGYEVYGTLAYGRGLTIESYKNLLSIGGMPTDTASMLSIEAFLALNIVEGAADVGHNLTMMTPEAKAKLASSLDVPLTGLQGALEALADGSTSMTIFVRNTPVTTSSRGQSFTMVVSAEELATLTASDTTICLCKGTENSHWIQAFTGEFVELHGDESVNEFLINEAVDAGYDYMITKQALAGEMMDLSTGNKLAETFAAAQGAVASLTNAVQTAGEDIDEEFREARDEVVRSAEAVEAAFDDPLNPDAGVVADLTAEQEAEREAAVEERLDQTVGVPADGPPLGFTQVSEGRAQAPPTEED
jgi:hypothetical protein